MQRFSVLCVSPNVGREIMFFAFHFSIHRNVPCLCNNNLEFRSVVLDTFSRNKMASAEQTKKKF